MHTPFNTSAAAIIPATMKVSDPIRIAIIGQGLIGPRHTEAVLEVTGSALACIVDPLPASAAKAAKYHCPIFLSVAAMLQDKDLHVDAAIVCSPNHTHVTRSKQLLLAGTHVLCEKPVYTDISSGLSLIQTANASSRQLLIGHHRRFNPYAVAVKQHLASLGRLIAMNGVWTLYKPLPYFDPPTEWRRLSSTGGPILINLIHEVDLLHYWYGPITRVYVEQALKQRHFDAEEGVAITFRFESGMVGTFLLCDAVVSPYSFEAGTGENPTIPKTGGDFHHVFGTEGSLSVPDMTRWNYGSEEKTWTNELVAERLEVPEMKVPFVEQIEHFLRVIRGEEKARCDGIEALRAVVVCEAVKKSMKECRPVDADLDSML